jgi:hypothetical protein
MGLEVADEVERYATYIWLGEVKCALKFAAQYITQSVTSLEFSIIGDDSDWVKNLRYG